MMEIEHGASFDAGFAALKALLQLMADPKAVEAQLAEIADAWTLAKEQAATADRAKAALAQAKAEHDAHCAGREVAVAEREAELVAVEARWKERNAALDARQLQLSEDGQRKYLLDQVQQAMRYADWATGQIMRISHLDVAYSSVLQARPGLEKLVDEIESDFKSAARDPEFERDPDGSVQVLPVENLVSGTSLSRSGRRARVEN